MKRTLLIFVSIFIVVFSLFFIFPQSTGIEKNTEEITIMDTVDTSYYLIDGKFPDTLIIDCEAIPGSQ